MERGGVKTGKENSSGSRESFYPRSGSDFYCTRCFRVEGIHFKVKSRSFVGAVCFPPLRSKQEGGGGGTELNFAELFSFPKFELIFWNVLYFIFFFYFYLTFSSYYRILLYYYNIILNQLFIRSYILNIYRVRFSKW